MSSIIEVRNISKRYFINGTRTVYGSSFRDVMYGVADKLLRRHKEAKSDAFEFWALKDINLDIERGSRIGIIGRNGAGKSTLLKILSRIVTPTTGKITIKGKLATLLEVGTGFHPELTGRENIYLNGSILGMRRNEIQKKFDEIVAFSEVEQFLDTPVKRYSSGMYVRLAFAVAANLEPDVLVVDEVLAVGDAAFQKKCIQKMQSVSNQDGRTVIFVSHSMGAVETLCNRAVLIDKGKIQYDSSDVVSVIKKYYGSDENNKSSVWTAKTVVKDRIQNKWIEPISFSLVDENGEEPIQPIQSKAGVYVDMVFDVLTEDEGLIVGYSVISNEGLYVYHSSCFDTKKDKWFKLKKGRNHLRAPIPKYFLNEGEYRVEFNAEVYNRYRIYEKNKSDISVFLSIRGGLSESDLWIERRPGVLAPVIEWQKL